MKSRALYPALVAFCVAAAGLLLQIVQTRIYAVVYWNHLVYFIVSVALLGFGISGTWLAFGPDTRLARFLTLRRSALAFVLAAIVSSLVIPQTGISFVAALGSKTQLLRMLLTYSVAVLPYFFAGWILGVVYRDYAERIHFLYFADLVGAAVGCLLVLALLQPLGAVALVLLACAFVAVPILLKPGAGALGWATAVVVLAGLGALYAYDDAINKRIVPDLSKAFNREFANLPPGDEKVHELSEWNLLARTDVVGSTKSPRKVIFIDGDAFTDMATYASETPPPFHPEAEPLVSHQAPYLFPRPWDSVLVIGSGGGTDVWAALRAGANRIDAVDINPTTARIMQKEYADVVSGLFNRPEVRAYNEEGRGFLRSRPDKYNLVMINAIDTFAAVDQGAYMLAENYLYTVDAVKEYVTHLKPEGVLCITRWDYAGESSRLFAMTLEALYELGYPDPEAHICAAIRNGWVAVMASPTPFTERELALLRAHAEKHGGLMVYPLEEEQWSIPLQNVVHRYARAREAGMQEQFFEDYRFNIRPVYDDSPFFFHYQKASSLKRVLTELDPSHFIRGNWSQFTLTALLILTTVALVLFVAAPLVRRGPAVVPGFGLWLLYFFCLGFAFIFVEISLMQRFALLLGHPARSLALVLAALLFFAGVGSDLKGRVGLRTGTALGLLAAGLVVAAFGYPYLIEAALGLPLLAREAFTVALVAPLGLLMGMPFPSGIRAVAAQARDAVPWMWGVNGGATVLGSIAAIALAIRFGFTVVLLLAALGYAVALVAHWRVSRIPAPALPETEPVATPQAAAVPVETGTS